MSRVPVLPAAIDLEAAPRSLTTLAFDRLRSDILAGDLRPKEKLRVQPLSQRYGIGATAIREALSRLVTEGLVTSEDQRGFCVAGVSNEELADLTRTRSWIEQTALRAAIVLGDVEWETGVLASFHRLSRIDPPSTGPQAAVAWRQAHRQFHFALIGGCGSPWTLRLCALLYDQTERYRSLSGKAPAAARRDVLKEHRQITDAVLGRDADRACALLAAHFESTTRIILAQEGMGAVASAPRRRARA